MPLIIVILLAALLSSGNVAPVAAGFIVGVALGLIAVYRLGWNARGDFEQDQAIEGVRKKNAANRM